MAARCVEVRPCADTSKGLAKSKQQRASLEASLAEVQGKFRSSKADHRESERERRSEEAKENLTRLFSGVHGRMTDVCKPTQRKYHHAVTQAMGKNLEAIIVDEEKTAIECIAYLKEKRCPPETFIPLDSIRAKPVRDAMRQLVRLEAAAEPDDAAVLEAKCRCEQAVVLSAKKRRQEQLAG